MNIDTNVLEPEEIDIIQLKLDQLPLTFILNNGQLRNILSNGLNYEQLIPTSDGKARDYRGLADLYKLSYTNLRNLSRSSDPLIQLLTNVDTNIRKQQFTDGLTNVLPLEGSVASLVRHLRSIERFDMIDDLMIELKKLNLNNQFLDKPKIVDQIKNVSMIEFENERPDEIITVDDLNLSGIQSIYDAYVSYADNDLAFVQNLCDFLESPQVGLKLFVRERDLLIGQLQFHAFTELMEKRCKRLLVVLSPEFLNSAECEFQTKFTMSLQIQERQRRIVPILYRSCELPPLIRFLSKIDLSRGDQIPQWTWRKLIFSLKTQNQDGVFLPANNPLMLPMPPTTSASAETVTQVAQPIQPEINEMISPSPTTCKVPKNPFNSESLPIITEMDSSLSSGLSDKCSAATSGVQAQTITSSEKNKPQNNITTLPLLSRLWKKINRTPVKNKN